MAALYSRILWAVMEMDKQQFARRLSELRLSKGVSARDMSLSLGQSAGYINNIENCVNLPSMTVFFYICDYLDITPKEFFDTDSRNPSKAHSLIDICNGLSDTQLDNLIALAKDIKR